MFIQEIMFSQGHFKNWASVSGPFNVFDRSLPSSTKLQLFYHQIQQYCEITI